MFHFSVCNLVFSKQNGGLEQASLDYARAFLALGYEVSCLVGDRAPFLPHVQALGCSVLPVTNRFGRFDVPAIWQIRQHIRRAKPDVLVAHGNRAIMLSRMAAKGLCPVVAVNHTHSVKASVNADAVIVVNAALKQSLLALGHKHADNIHVVPNMVDVTQAQRDFPIRTTPRTPPVIGTLARFSPEKGLDVFLHAIAQVPGVHAHIGGDGAQRPMLEALAAKLGIADRVRFVGWVQDKQAFYHSLDIFCLASHHETFGIVILEAMQHKIPVIATQTTGAKQLTQGKGDVLTFVPSSDADALAASIKALLEDWQKAQQQAEKAFALVAENYDNQAVATQLKQIVENV